MIHENKLKRFRDKLQGLKMGSFVGNDQNTLLYDFMRKFKRLKQYCMQLKHSRKHSEFESIEK